MSSFNTVHIFKFGQIQIISDEINKTHNSSSIQTLSSFISELNNHRPTGTSNLPYHIIHIFGGDSIRYISVGSDIESDENGSFIVPISQFNQDVLNSFIQELKT